MSIWVAGVAQHKNMSTVKLLKPLGEVAPQDRLELPTR
jgi:hypothetical protein